jgi:transposase-like protein
MKNRAANVYLSTCCQVPATKNACVRSESDKKEKSLGQAGLGKWRCSGCGKKTSVKLSIDKKD